MKLSEDENASKALHEALDALSRGEEPVPLLPTMYGLSLDRLLEIAHAVRVERKLNVGIESKNGGLIYVVLPGL